MFTRGGEIPTSLIQQFEKETGIEVHFSTYDSNETLYAKLRSSKQPLYDVIMPSAYFVERMKTQGMLMRLEEKSCLILPTSTPPSTTATMISAIITVPL